MDLSNEATKQALLTAVRIIISAVGVLLSKYKIVDEAQVSTALAFAQDVVTMLMIVVPLVYEIYARFKSEIKSKEREAVALNAGIKMADATPGPTPPVPHENAQNVIAAVTSVPPQAIPQVDPTPALSSDPAVTGAIPGSKENK